MKLARTQNGIITKQNIIDLLNVTPSQAYKIIKQLQNENKIMLLNGGKYAKYQIVE